MIIVTKTFLTFFLIPFFFYASLLGSGHICVLELKHGVEVGGKATCWGSDSLHAEEEKMNPPKDVSTPFSRT